jgi:UDP-2,3-diacylglucosamine pyrophosphatase LpxH
MSDPKVRLRYRTVIISDTHLGTKDAKARELLHFLKHVKCDKLVLNGDIIDFWSLRRKPYWTQEHTAVIRRILKMAEKKTEVVYLRGNHDDMPGDLMPLVLDRIRLESTHVHETAGGVKFLCIHGDAFDTVTTHAKWLAVLGDIGYQQLLRINRHYNRWRSWRGKEYFSLSQAIKSKVKSAVNYMSDFERHLRLLAVKEECKGIICGHIHRPENKWINGVHYINSGDWVESLTAIVEHHDGRMEVLDYNAFLRELTNAEDDAAENGVLEESAA